MRVVLDTNILVSSVLGGALRTIVDAWKAGKFTLIVSEAIVSEYLDVFSRPKFEISADEMITTTEYLLKTAEFVTTFRLTHISSPASKDQQPRATPAPPISPTNPWPGGPRSPANSPHPKT